MKILVKYWYWNSTHPLMWALLPLSYLYRLICVLHKWSYVSGVKKRFYAPVPVIIIGNITVGGTGKTPFTIALAAKLLENGYQPGIISRGYGGKANVYPQWVTAVSDPLVVGDESVLLAQSVPCPVVVAPNRADAIRMLLDKSNCNIILADDGLQHYAIKRDIEIAIVDSVRKFGNGLCLPAGPLREPLQRLAHVDYVVSNGTLPGYSYTLSLEAGVIYNLLNPAQKAIVSAFARQAIHAVAAIGHPQRFFNVLRKIGLQIVEHSFPDHHAFTLADFAWCGHQDIIIMTEKDAVKCRKFAAPNFWVLPIKAHLSENFIHDFFTHLSTT